MDIRLEDDGHCFVCGDSNPCGLKVIFEKTDNGAKAVFCADKRHQGYKDIVHGGIIASLLDEASVKALLLKGTKAVTADMTLRLKKPLFVGEDAIVRAFIVKGRGKVYEVEAEIKKAEGELIAFSRARLFRYG